MGEVFWEKLVAARDQRRKTCERANSLRKTLAHQRGRLQRAWQRSVYPLFLGASESLGGPPDAAVILTRVGGSIWNSFRADESQQSGD
jgi:hypothetical protein